VNFNVDIPKPSKPREYSINLSKMLIKHTCIHKYGMVIMFFIELVAEYAALFYILPIFNMKSHYVGGNCFPAILAL